MRLGPVFAADVRTTSRRAWCYATRAGLGLFLLAGVSCSYAISAGQASTSGVLAAQFSRLIFQVLAIIQAMAIIVITPAIVAGTIADERSRRTLDDLLASDLSSAEIVLGKFAARMLLVLGFLLVGLPILGSLTLLGGVEPAEVAWSVIVTASIAWFVGGISILASTVARSPREAVFAAYGLTAFWLCAGPFLDGPIRSSWPGLSAWIEPIAATLPMLEPLSLTGRSRGGAWVVAGLFGMGAAFATIAVGLLRRSERGETRAKPVRTRSWRRRPQVGDDPMRWKETRTHTRMGLVGKSTRAILILGALGLGLITAGEAAPAMREVIEFGYGAAGRAYAADRFNDFVRVAGTALYVLALVAVTASAAGSITSERAADTWTGIVASPMSASEILRAKRAGAYRRARGIIAATVAMWTVGLIAGAVHPLGFVAACFLLPIYIASAAAVGTIASLYAKTTAKALAIAVAATFILHVGSLLLCAPILWRTPVMVAGCSPILIYLAPASYGEMESLLRLDGMVAFGGRVGEFLAMMIGSACFYAALGVGLNIAATNSFDAAEDRPHRESGGSRRAA